MGTLILLRHGESVWNKKNLFTGWVDVPLSEKGISEARAAGKRISTIPIDIIFCSTLMRSAMTAMLVMVNHPSGKIPVVQHQQGKLYEWGQIYSEEEVQNIIPMIQDDALNERMYGKLQGLNKQKMREQYGDEQVKIWRRSFKAAPPSGESLEMTAHRAVPYFQRVITPHLHEGKNVLVSAHGNSIRGILKFLDSISDEDVVQLEVPTGIPIFYSFTGKNYTKL